MSARASSAKDFPEGYRPPDSFPGAETAREGILLGLSGGPDSMCLLDLLLAGGYPVTAVHVNHMIRGAEADRDEEFCRTAAAERGIPFIPFRRDVPAAVKPGGKGLEEAARDARYACFAEAAEKTGIRVIATAHNSDDNAETVLFNLARGCSARGACGIPPSRPFPEAGDGAVIVRPILGISKSEVLAYCAEKGIKYVTDSTNSDISYSRNLIRLTVIPRLREINPSFGRALLGFCASLREDADSLDSEAGNFVSSGGCSAPGAAASLPDPVLSRAILFSARAAGASPERRHVLELADAVREHRSCAVTLPGSVRGEVTRDGRILFRRDGRIKKQKAIQDKETERQDEPEDVQHER